MVPGTPPDWSKKVKKAYEDGLFEKASNEFHQLKAGQNGRVFYRLKGKSEVEALTLRTWSGTERIVWRSDTRPPTTIFTEGFTSWDSTPPNDSRYKRLAKGATPVHKSDLVPMFRDAQEDLDPDSAACVAVDPVGSAFLPLQNFMKTPFLYGCILKKGIDTYALQKALFPDSQPWRFNERCQDIIPPFHVLCAFTIHRRILCEEQPSLNLENATSSGIKFMVAMATYTQNPHLLAQKRERMKEKAIYSRQSSFVQKQVVDEYLEKIDSLHQGDEEDSSAVHCLVSAGRRPLGEL